MDIIGRIGDLCDSDDSIGTLAKMETLISIVTGESLGSTGEELVITSLMASKPSLLEKFAHSTALAKIDEWLNRSSTSTPPVHERTCQLLDLLKRMPMSVKALQSTGVGKTVNRLRKDVEASVQAKAKDLLKDWKSLLAPPAAAAPAPAPASAPASAPSSARSGPTACSSRRCGSRRRQP